ncbi:hypothetical protein LOK49_LG04G03212 [Camellia lanceoleosa]|uniref:Uncharacterized protein n=1 Tax=Camellia lanceoleosa TaxID=1840588 RepID=A0ACC0I4C7_9ERIC|nr:hypothetical protein LOK49_LG04G03212 [Camellia lanceoleosa]
MPDVASLSKAIVAARSLLKVWSIHSSNSLPKNLNQISLMVRCSCLHKQRRIQRLGIKEVIAILKGEERIYLTGGGAVFSSSGCVVDCCPQLQRTKSDMRSHFALAMLGVSSLKIYDHHLYCR